MLAVGEILDHADREDSRTGDVVVRLEDGRVRLARLRRDGPAFVGRLAKRGLHVVVVLAEVGLGVLQRNANFFFGSLSGCHSTRNWERTKLPLGARPGPFAGKRSSASASSLSPRYAR